MSPLSPAQAFGLNARRMRKAHNLTLEAVAIAAQNRGLKWSNSRVSALERGEIPPSLNTLVPFCLALSDCTGQAVSLADMLASDTPVRFNDAVVVPRNRLAEWVSGLPIAYDWAERIGPIRLKLPGIPDSLDIKDTGRLADTDPTAVRELLAKSGIAERRTSRDLGISLSTLAILSQKLWGRTFADERDRRLPTDAPAQSRGRVSRVLKAELKSEMSNGDS